jgi:anti-sigma factor RsiW
MNCSQAGKALSRHLDGELPAGEVASLEKHLSSCSACRETAAEWRGYGSALRADAPNEIPDPTKAWHDIRRSLRNRENPIPTTDARPWWARPLPWAGVAATVALFTVGTFFQLSPSSGFPYGSAVESVDTDLPGASTVVYVDEETGWNIVWVLESESDPDPRT